MGHRPFFPKIEEAFGFGTNRAVPAFAGFMKFSFFTFSLLSVRRGGFAFGLGMAVFSLAGCALRREKPLALQDTPPLSHPAEKTFRDLNPRFSPDGRQIAWVRLYPDRTQAVFTADADLSHPRQRTEAEQVCPDRPYASGRDSLFARDTLAWSPEGGSLAFTRAAWFDFGGKESFPGTELWRLDLKTGGITPLAVRPGEYSGTFFYYKNPVWSPDGKRIAFTGEGIGGQRAVFVRNFALQEADEVAPRFDKFADSDGSVWEPLREGETEAALLFRQGIRRAPWLPLTESLRRLRLSAPDGAEAGEIWRLSTRRAQIRFASSFGTAIPRIGQLVPSPDGRKIAFVLTPDALDPKRFQVGVLDRSGKQEKAVAVSSGGNFAPFWKDAETLGCLSPLNSQSNTGFEIRAISLRTGKIQPLGTLETADFDVSPDRSAIVFARSSSSLHMTLGRLRLSWKHSTEHKRTAR